MRHARPRGFTLTELMVVMVIAGVVTLGLLGFYLNSQATWLDASSQALAQRDATTLVEGVAAKARDAVSAGITLSPNGADVDTVLTFYGKGFANPYSFWWSHADSLVHQGAGSGATDEGPVVASVVEQFSVALSDTLPLVELRVLQVRSGMGEHIRLSTNFALYNAPSSP